MFADKVLIRVKGGRGGNGCVSFLRERFVPKGGPDGGDGGNGGNVTIQGTLHEHSLAPLKYNTVYNAENGLPGAGKRMHGRNGKDKVILVPVGTVIRNINQERKIIGDIDSLESQIIVAHGGKGGRGNSRFASSTNQYPRQSKPGKDGDEVSLELELKIIADVGLIGYPNAGKSTFLGAISNAKPKTASYPFTTLVPHIGNVEFDDFVRFTIADIPGIIEGAHRNFGLGHDFLKHIERTKVLAYVLDMSGKDENEPWEILSSIIKELKCYQVDLPNRTSIILANKMDLEGADKNLSILRTKTKLTICPISAIKKIQLKETLSELRSLLRVVKK